MAIWSTILTVFSPAPRGSWSHRHWQEVPWYQQGPPLQQHLWWSPPHLEAPEHPELLEIPLSVGGVYAGIVGYGQNLVSRMCLFRSKLAMTMSSLKSPVARLMQQIHRIRS